MSAALRSQAKPALSQAMRLILEVQRNGVA